MPDLPVIALTVDPASLRLIIEQIVEIVLSRTEQLHDPKRLAYTEEEAAALIGLKRHQLRDERLRRRINYGSGPRGVILYRVEDLQEYLLFSRARRDKAAEQKKARGYRSKRMAEKTTNHFADLQTKLGEKLK